MNEGNTVRSVIGEDTQITGTIRCSGPIQVDGALEGDLTCAGKATIGATARIKGNLNVESVGILGEINGNVMAKDRIELKSGARMLGDIKARRLTVEDGVTFVGKSDVNPAGSGEPRTNGGEDKGEPAPAPVPPAGADEVDTRGRPGFFGRK